MTRAAKITYFAALLIGFSIGAFFEFQTVAPMLKAYYDARQETAPMAFSRFSYLQYSYADDAHAQAARRVSTSLRPVVMEFSEYFHLS